MADNDVAALAPDLNERGDAAWSSGAATVGRLGERALIERIRSRVPAPPAWLSVGIGDDAAVWEPARGTLDVVTTDALVEGMHFDRSRVTPADVGYKALAVNLSDLAAMGSAPRVAVLSLGLFDELPVSTVDGLVDGFLDCADRYGMTLVGGNVTRSPGPLIVSITAIGSVKRRKVLTRSGARAGDEIYVSGQIGAAAAALRALGGETAGDRETATQCGLRYRRPEPRTRLGLMLGRTGAATACIDLSDGLAGGVRQLAEASGVGARVEASLLPIDPAARAWFEGQGSDPVLAAVTGGEDYELLFTVSGRHRGRLRGVARHVQGLKLTRVGVITAGPDLRLQCPDADVPLPAGFEHF